MPPAQACDSKRVQPSVQAGEGASPSPVSKSDPLLPASAGNAPAPQLPSEKSSGSTPGGAKRVCPTDVALGQVRLDTPPGEQVARLRPEQPPPVAVRAGAQPPAALLAALWNPLPVSLFGLLHGSIRPCGSFSTRRDRPMHGGPRGVPGLGAI